MNIITIISITIYGTYSKLPAYQIEVSLHWTFHHFVSHWCWFFRLPSWQKPISISCYYSTFNIIWQLNQMIYNWGKEDAHLDRVVVVAVKLIELFRLQRDGTSTFKIMIWFCLLKEEESRMSCMMIMTLLMLMWQQLVGRIGVGATNIPPMLAEVELEVKWRNLGKDWEWRSYKVIQMEIQYQSANNYAHSRQSCSIAQQQEIALAVPPAVRRL